MASLLDRLNTSISDLDSQIAYIEARGKAEIAVLTKKRAALQAALKLITPEIEETVAGLQKLGVAI